MSEKAITVNSLLLQTPKNRDFIQGHEHQITVGINAIRNRHTYLKNQLSDLEPGDPRRQQFEDELALMEQNSDLESPQLTPSASEKLRVFADIGESIERTQQILQTLVYRLNQVRLIVENELQQILIENQLSLLSPLEQKSKFQKQLETNILEKDFEEKTQLLQTIDEIFNDNTVRSYYFESVLQQRENRFNNTSHGLMEILLKEMASMAITNSSNDWLTEKFATLHQPPKLFSAVRT